MSYIKDKRWGKKLLLLFCTFFFMFGGTMMYASMNSYMSAETTTIDDGPLGDEIIDVATNGKTNVALSKKGIVYAWGENLLGEVGNETAGQAVATPQKVLE